MKKRISKIILAFFFLATFTGMVFALSCDWDKIEKSIYMAGQFFPNKK